MTYRSHKKSEKRFFDHLYDPLCKLSDRTSFWRENYLALVESAPIHVAPNFKLMFSELPRDQRQCRFHQQNPLPFNRGCECRQMQRSFPLDTNQFSKNPKINPKRNLLNFPDEPENKGCQTIFRETSAQTLPCFTEVKKKCPGESKVPEFIQISKLIINNHPPGLQEVEKVERFRIQKFWEEKLLGSEDPPLNLEEKLKILEALGWDEWVRKEKEINEDQEARLNYVKCFVAENDKENLEVAGTKLQALCEGTCQELARKKWKLRRKTQRSRTFSFKRNILGSFDYKIPENPPKRISELPILKSSELNLVFKFPKKSQSDHVLWTPKNPVKNALERRMNLYTSFIKKHQSPGQDFKSN